MRLIDADVLKQHIDKLPALPDGNFAGNHSALKALINMQPTIESSTNCSEIQNSSDCISRQAAIDALKRKQDDGKGDLSRFYNTIIQHDIEAIMQLPSADEPSQVARDIARIVENEQDMRVIAQSEKRTETHACDSISRKEVKHLDLFTKTYCRDKSVKDDLVFRCNQCDFQLQDGTCLVKTMARKLCPDYRDFGSMGDL